MSVVHPAGEQLQHGLALAQAGQLSQAKAVLEAIFKDNDLGGQAQALFAQILIAEGQHALAQRHLAAAIETNRTVAQWHQALGDCCLVQKQYSKAISAYTNAVAIEPHLTAAWFNLGICHQQTGDLSAARAALGTAKALEPKAPDILNNFASVSFQLSDIDAATAAYEAAAQIDRRNPDLLANLALCYEASNQPEDAEKFATAALALQKENALAVLVLGRLKMQKKDYQSAIGLFDQAIGQSNPQFAFSFLMNKAQCYDQLGAYDAAYRTAEQGHAHNLRNPNHERNVHAAIAAVKENERLFLDLRFRGPDDTRREGERPPPVFFVGFPRSGTTLVEQMLAHHPDVFASSEITPLGGVFDWLKQTFPNESYPNVLQLLSKDHLETLRRVYWDWMDHRFGSPKAPVFVDKMPMNILAVGLIDLIFPDAKILCVLRDPRDVIVSCYFQDFTQNFSTSTFNTLPSTAEYYGMVMDFWMRMKPSLRPQLCEYRYEDLVSDSETTLKGIFEFIGLDWRPDSTAYRTGLAGKHIGTPSRVQVSKPISAGAIGRWKNYSNHVLKLEDLYRHVLQAYYS